MEISKIQKIVRKAIKEYEITAKYDEEVLVLFLLADIFREANGLNVEVTARVHKKKDVEGVIDNA